ncbi:uncharacterized protein FOMMEDRAFT_18249, partial [Fomitiporia mediterranea MF3/22]|uniref:uncharacterized protein n=1 Tax=Fomitiporia mediterranea (strain MF3/22) TaxID=694068 RepID=UPI000440840C
MPSARSSMPPPPTPVSATSTVTTFPPALPPKPAFLNPPNDSLKKESLTREERRKLWGERIELLFEAGAAKRAYSDCVTDVKEKQVFTSSERTERLGDAVRESITRSLQAAEAKRETARSRSLSTHEKLLELDFWPVRRRPELTELVKREEEEKVIEDGHAEVKKQASELGDALSRIDRQLKEVTQFVASRTKSNAVPTSTPMDGEPTDATARATKRRKVGEDSAYTSDSGSTTLGRASPSPAASASAAIARQHRQIRKRLTKLESDFHELENLYIQSEHDAQEELESQVDHYVDTRREEFVKEPLARVTRLEKNVERLDKDVKVIVVELTELIGAEEEMREVMNNIMEEQARAEAEGARIRAATVESIFRGNDLQEQLEAQLKEWEIVNAKLASLEKEKEKEKNNSSSHLPSPESPSSDPSLSLPPAHTPTLQHLFTLLFPHVLDAIRTKFVVPHLIETKEDVV